MGREVADDASSGPAWIAVVVFGEDPYAEFQGDLPNLMFKAGKSGDLELIKKLKADGIPVQDRIQLGATPIVLQMRSPSVVSMSTRVVASVPWVASRMRTRKSMSSNPARSG